MNTSDIANEILQYFNQHPNASDTIEGISMWILRNEDIQSVKFALNYLIDSGKVQCKTLQNGSIVYLKLNSTK